MAAIANAGAGEEQRPCGKIVEERFKRDGALAPSEEVLESLRQTSLRFLAAALRPLRDRTLNSAVFLDIISSLAGKEEPQEKPIGLSAMADVFSKSYVARKMCVPTKNPQTGASVRDATCFVVSTEAIGNCQFVAIASALAIREAMKESQERIRAGRPLVLSNRLRDITGTSRGSKVAGRCLRALAVKWLSEGDAPCSVGTRRELVDLMMTQGGDPSAANPTAEQQAALRREYLLRMSRETVWGDHLTLIALADVCNCTIQVYRYMSGKKFEPEKMPAQPKISLVETFEPSAPDERTSTIRLLWDGRICGQTESAHYMPLITAAERWSIPITHAMSFNEVEAAAERVGFVSVAEADQDPPEEGQALPVPQELLDVAERTAGDKITAKAKEFLGRMLAVIISNLSYTTARFARHNRAHEAGDLEAYGDKTEVRVSDVVQAASLHGQTISMEMKGGRSGYVLEESLIRALALEVPAESILEIDGTDVSQGGD